MVSSKHRKWKIVAELLLQEHITVSIVRFLRLECYAEW